MPLPNIVRPRSCPRNTSHGSSATASTISGVTETSSSRPRNQYDPFAGMPCHRDAGKGSQQRSRRPPRSARSGSRPSTALCGPRASRRARGTASMLKPSHATSSRPPLKDDTMITAIGANRKMKTSTPHTVSATSDQRVPLRAAPSAARARLKGHAPTPGARVRGGGRIGRRRRIAQDEPVASADRQQDEPHDQRARAAIVAVITRISSTAIAEPSAQFCAAWN